MHAILPTRSGAGDRGVKPWLKWLLLALFLTAIGVIQFIPG
jgi:hypothetical protein